MKNYLMSRGAEKVVKTCVKVKAGEEVLIVTEVSKMSIAEALAEAIYAVGAQVIIAIMEPRSQDSEEPPKTIANAMKTSDAFISVVGKSITHTHAVKDAVANGSRGVVLTQFQEQLMIHGGIECDFEKAKIECKAMAAAMAGAKELILTTKAGTNLRYSAEGRRGNSLYCMVEKGEFSTIPTVEANVSPVEGSANGVIVADASIPYIGIGVLDEPVICEVKNGFIVSIKGGRQAEMLRRDLEAKNDPNVFNIAENGIGLNPKCHFMSFMLEDEGVYGSAHIGIGTSITLGGTVKASCHYDLIMKDATLVADGKTLLKDGKFNIK
jgi:leucyl aminopeptidase (aminopeptidase T)